MKQVPIHGPGDVRVDAVPEPEAGPRAVVVEVAACGICGSDLRYGRLGGRAGPMPSPMPPKPSSVFWPMRVMLRDS